MTLSDDVLLFFTDRQYSVRFHAIKESQISVNISIFEMQAGLKFTKSSFFKSLISFS